MNYYKFFLILQIINANSLLKASNESIDQRAFGDHWHLESVFLNVFFLNGDH